MAEIYNLQSFKSYLANASCKAIAATAKNFSISAHAAGAIVDMYLPVHPIADANGADIACLGNTSLVLTLNTLITNEVSIATPDASLANGDYWVNPLTGHIHGRAADTSTTLTANYNVFALITATTA